MNKGIFYITGQLVDKETANVSRVLCLIKFVPILVEYRPETDCYTYIGYSPLFKEVPEGARFPEYEIIVNDLNPDNVTVSVEEMKRIDTKTIKQLNEYYSDTPVTDEG